MKKREKKARDGRRKNIMPVILLVFILIAAVLITLVTFITDLLWFKEMGYVSVFFTKLVTQLKFGIPAFVLLSALMNLYLRKIKKGYFKKIVSAEETNLKRLNVYTNILSLVFGIIVSMYFVTNLWFQALEFTNSTEFGIDDPLFGLDVSFYIFKFEFLKHFCEILIGVIALFMIATLVYYGILITMHTPDAFEEDEAEPVYDEAPDPNNPFAQMFGFNIPPRKKKHISHTNIKTLMDIASGQLTGVGVILFLMIGVNFFLKQFELLHSHSGVVFGAGFTDVNITLWMYRIVMVLAVAGAIGVVVFMKKKQYKKILAVPVAMIAVNAIGLAASLLVQSYVVSPDEINKEGKYLKNNIEYTQYAYDLNDVDVKSFAADNSLTVDDLATNNDTISNIRINDYPPVKTFYNQTQSIRQYYKFNDIDVDRYNIDGKYTQTYLSLREIEESAITDTWLNRHLKYTHGYGLALSRVNTITASGQPDVLIKNIPPQSSTDSLQVTRPEIYFGELSNDYVIVNTSEEEFDYPDGNSNKYTKYEGDAGIKMNFFNRIMFSMREGSMKMLVSSNIKSDSRIIINRNVVERVKTIMPSLDYEDDPYAFMVDGKLYWMVDAYTTSPYYPYSEPYNHKEGGVNYIRNSIKVVVDAYNGDVNYYIVDKDDPIAQTYKKIYPKLFKTLEDMPEGMREHIRYPNKLFKIQADVYGRYHMEDEKVFYQNEDYWDLAHEIYGTDEQTMTPNYYIVKLPGEETTEFISSIPYTPKSKQNMTALMIARNDGEHYGELVLYQFPKNKTIYGPMQIEAQIDQNTKISQDFSLWSQAGSKYSRGNLFVIPIENSLLYVEPIYLEAANSAIPEVKRVIVAYGDKIAYEPTLAEALASMFGEGSGLESVAEEGQDAKADSKKLTTSDYIKKAVDAYDSAQKALKNGDWAEYGKQMSELESALNALS